MIGLLLVASSDAGLAVVLQATLLGLAAMLAGMGVGDLLNESLVKVTPTWKAIPPDAGRSDTSPS